MPPILPPEIQVHQNRISVEIRELFKSTLKGKFSPSSSSKIGKLMWNIVSDPVYESDEELKYLACKIGVIVGHYDVAVKSMEEKVPGTLVWGSLALFEIGEPEQAFQNLEKILKEEIPDYIPLIESTVILIYLKSLIGDTEEISNYLSLLDSILSSRQSRLLPEQVKRLTNFAEGLVNIHTKSAATGYEQIENFYLDCKKIGDQYWQLLALLALGEQKLDFSDFISSEKIYTEAHELAKNLSNGPLMGAAEIGLAHTLFLKGELKQANYVITQAIRNLQGRTQFYLGRGYFVKGKILARLGQHTTARENFQLSEKLAQKYNDHNHVLMSMLAIADDYLLLNELKKSSEIYNKAYNKVVNITNKKQFTHALVQIATGDFYQGNLDKALERINRIETLSEEIVYQKGKTDSIRLRAMFNIQQSIDIPKQIRSLQAAQILYLEVGDEVSSANCDILIAKAYIKLGDTKNASHHLERAKEYYLTISDNLMIAEIKEIQAEFDINRGKYDEALVRLRSSYSHFSDIYDTGGRSRCLRKIADTLALKGSFDESIARYKKVKAILKDTKNDIEKIVICCNSARVYSGMKEFAKALKEYKEAEEILIKKNLKEYLLQIAKEKTHIYSLIGNEEEFKNALTQIEKLSEETGKSLEDYISLVESEISIKNQENYQDIYMNLMTQLQKSIVEKNVITSIGLLLNIIQIIIEENANINVNEVTKEEMRNYINLIKTLSIDSKFYYLQGISYLINILWLYLISENYKKQIIIAEASEFFAAKGIEDLANLSIEIQYNFNKWNGGSDSKLEQLLVSPKHYDSPIELLKLIIAKGKETLFLELIKTTEHEIVKNLL
ncbi:MAG: tetratricopeptide repeat protein [Candidatus Heimdallarchaeaceae archaeon]